LFLLLEAAAGIPKEDDDKHREFAKARKSYHKHTR
jgi:hypothetical protein